MKRIWIVAGIVVTALVITMIVVLRDGSGTTVPKDAMSPPLVREDSHRLDEVENPKAVLVEFLDLECEACASAFPVVEQIREEFKGQLTVIARYFPVPSHKNAMNAALAVEAAAQQGKFEDMYQMMYQTQTTWGEKQDSQAALFRTYAQKLGLDLAKYDEAVASEQTAARIKKDYDDGVSLGVEGTPTFFLNGKKLEPKSAEDFRAKIEAALK